MQSVTLTNNFIIAPSYKSSLLIHADEIRMK